MTEGDPRIFHVDQLTGERTEAESFQDLLDDATTFVPKERCKTRSFDQVVRRLRFSVECPACGEEHEFDGFRLVNALKKGDFIYTHVAECMRTKEEFYFSFLEEEEGNAKKDN